eukprot:12382195-Ditylum_brightwellii.AAC.1
MPRPTKRIKQDAVKKDKQVKEEVTTGDGTNPKVAVTVANQTNKTTKEITKAAKEKTEKEPSGVMMYKPNNNNNKSNQDSFKVMHEVYGLRETTTGGNK